MGRGERIVAAMIAVLVVAAAAVGVVFVRQRSGSETAATSEPDATSSAQALPASPLTGRPAKANQPVLAVKIDNVSPARPQTGIDKADLIYVEPVEGGLSRIMAIFSSKLPSRIGPVRSARESDLELLGQFGTPGLIYSGANKTVLAAIASASLVDLSPDRVASAYSRSSAQPAPHNLMVDPRALAERDGISPAQDIGFRFGEISPGVGTATTKKTVRYGAASTSFSYSAKRGKWDISFDGSPASTAAGTRLRASTVVVQYTDITSSTLHDVLGNPTPYTQSVGSGTAVVLRDGVAIDARWSRSAATAGTTFATTAGAALPFKAGQTWIVFAPKP